MKNPLREINEKFSKLKMFSAEWFYILGAIVGIPLLLNIFLGFNIKILGYVYIGFGFLLGIEDYFYQKKRLEDAKK